MIAAVGRAQPPARPVEVRSKPQLNRPKNENKSGSSLGCRGRRCLARSGSAQHFLRTNRSSISQHIGSRTRSASNGQAVQPNISIVRSADAGLDCCHRSGTGKRSELWENFVSDRRGGRKISMPMRSPSVFSAARTGMSGLSWPGVPYNAISVHISGFSFNQTEGASSVIALRIYTSSRIQMHRKSSWDVHRRRQGALI